MKSATRIALMALLIGNVALAAGYTGPAKIDRIGSMGANGSFEIIGAWNNVDNCSNPAKFVVGSHATDTEQSQDAKYSMLLAAQMSGQTVELYVDGCNFFGQPIVKGIWTPRRY